MKIYAIIVSLFLIVGCVHISNNSSAVDIDGTWRGEIEFGTLTGIGKPGETFRSVPPRKINTFIFFNFKREGDTINGTICGNHLPGKCIPLDDIEIKGEKITFTFPSMNVLTREEQTEIKTSCNGKLKGDQIDLNIITERPILPIPGSLYSRQMEVRNRSKDIVGSRRSLQAMGRGGVVDNDADTPEKQYLTYEITLERISNIPENPINY